MSDERATPAPWTLSTSPLFLKLGGRGKACQDGCFPVAKGREGYCGGPRPGLIVRHACTADPAGCPLSWEVNPGGSWEDWGSSSCSPGPGFLHSETWGGLPSSCANLCVMPPWGPSLAPCLLHPHEKLFRAPRGTHTLSVCWLSLSLVCELHGLGTLLCGILCPLPCLTRNRHSEFVCGHNAPGGSSFSSC